MGRERCHVQLVKNLISVSRKLIFINCIIPNNMVSFEVHIYIINFDRFIDDKNFNALLWLALYIVPTKVELKDKYAYNEIT